MCPCKNENRDKEDETENLEDFEDDENVDSSPICSKMKKYEYCQALCQISSMIFSLKIDKD